MTTYQLTLKLLLQRLVSLKEHLVTPSRFDDFLNGKTDALTDAEKEGLNIFMDKGCASCHNGIALGGTMQPFEVAA